MDRKQSTLLAEVHHKITTGDFGETEVHSLWGLLRQDEPRKGRSPVRELGDFVGHRERDRGGVHEHIRLTKGKIDTFLQGGVSIDTRPVYSQKEIEEGLDKAFARHGLSGLQEWAHAAVQFVTLAMLQDVLLLDKKGAPFGRLGLSFTYAHVQLNAIVDYAVVFPVLLVQNRWYPMKPTDVPFLPRQLVRVRFHEGVPEILGAQP